MRRGVDGAGAGLAMSATSAMVRALQQHGLSAVILGSPVSAAMRRSRLSGPWLWAHIVAHPPLPARALPCR
jgi:hypothetical protein